MSPAQVIHITPTAKRILAARPKAGMPRRRTFDEINIVEIIMQILKSMASRLDAVLERVGGQPSHSDDIDQRYQQAEQRRQDIQKELHVAKVERLSQAHEEKKIGRNGFGDPAIGESTEEQRGEQVGLRFDRSTGAAVTEELSCAAQEAILCLKIKCGGAHVDCNGC
jgi:hypothetical protein